ncbi:MAG: hypothetical protein ACREOF_06200 [Gemmatimonadales bacterium]
MSYWMIVVVLTVALTGCAAPRSMPVAAAPAPPAPTPRAEPPVKTIVQLVEPAGATGELVMIHAASSGDGQGRITIPVVDAPSVYPLGFAFGFTKVSLTTHALALAVKNAGSRPVSILWDQASLTGPDGVSRRVVHRGIRLVDRGQAMVPTTIPPGGAVEDFVFPADRIDYSTPTRLRAVNTRVGDGWSYGQYFERLRAGETVSLYLPLQIGGETTPHTFRFRVITVGL